MTLTVEQYNALLARLTKIERTLNDIITAQNRFVSLTEVNEVFTVLQQGMDALTLTMNTLDDRVETIENEPYDDNG
jgi:uncharacterized coiled-coil protein SlyX